MGFTWSFCASCEWYQGHDEISPDYPKVDIGGEPMGTEGETWSGLVRIRVLGLPLDFGLLGAYFTSRIAILF